MIVLMVVIKVVVVLLLSAAKQQDYTTTNSKSLSATSALASAARKSQHKANKQQRQQQIASATKKATNSSSSRSKSAAKPIGVRSPSNRALVQSDPLFHLYLICVGLITLSILAIKSLIPGMPIYAHTVIGFAFLLAIIVASIIYTQFKSRKVSTLPVRTCRWRLLLAAWLLGCQSVD